MPRRKFSRGPTRGAVASPEDVRTTSACDVSCKIHWKSRVTEATGTAGRPPRREHRGAPGPYWPLSTPAAAGGGLQARGDAAAASPWRAHPGPGLGPVRGASAAPRAVRLITCRGVQLPVPAAAAPGRWRKVSPKAAVQDTNTCCPNSPELHRPSCRADASSAGHPAPRRPRRCSGIVRRSQARQLFERRCTAAVPGAESAGIDPKAVVNGGWEPAALTSTIHSTRPPAPRRRRIAAPAKASRPHFHSSSTKTNLRLSALRFDPGGSTCAGEDARRL